MHFLVISTPRAEKPSEARANQKSLWAWLEPLIRDGTAKQWQECVPATFEVMALLPWQHQAAIAQAQTNPMAL